jgi:hypothetical protein
LVLFLARVFENTGSFDLAHNVPGVRTFMTRAWAFHLRDPNDLELDQGFRALCTFLRYAPISSGSDEYPNALTNLQELAAGARGTSALAHLVIRHIELFSDGKAEGIYLLHSVIAMLHEIGERDIPLRLELLSQGILKSIKAISSLLDGRFTNLTDLVPACVLLVTSLLATYPVYLWIKKAAAAGFLPVFLRSSIRSDCYNFREKFANFIKFLTISTVYRSVLRPLQESGVCQSLQGST